MYIFVAAIVIRQEKQLSRNTADRDERTISVAAYREQERRGERERDRREGEGGHRKADRKLLRAYTRSQSQCRRGSRSVRVRVRVRVQRTVTPSVVRTGPMQKFCYVIIERSCTIRTRRGIP